MEKIADFILALFWAAFLGSMLYISFSCLFHWLASLNVGIV